MTNPTPLALTLAELRELHALPDEALLNVQEAAAFLRLSPNALNWYRSQRRGPSGRIRQRCPALSDRQNAGQHLPGHSGR